MSTYDGFQRVAFFFQMILYSILLGRELEVKIVSRSLQCLSFKSLYLQRSRLDHNVIVNALVLGGKVQDSLRGYIIQYLELTSLLKAAFDLNRERLQGSRA